MKDYVKCSNCNYEGTVELGTDICHKCNFNGGLAWVENMPQEVEDNFIKKDK